MRNLIISAGLALLCSLCWGKENVSLLDDSIHFTLPSGFTQLTPEEISSKFGRGIGRPPIAAFGDKQRNATIAFTLSPSKEPFTELKVLGFLKVAPELFKQKIEGVNWHKDEIISANGRKWGRMHYSVKNINTDAKNDMYITSFRGNLFGVNLTANEQKWPASQPVLLSAFQSIKIRE